MKKLIILGTFALLTTTLFSCTADEYETTDKKTEIKNNNLKDTIQASGEDEGPGDAPVPITPPKK